jgi:hypothetical protein
VNAGVKTEIIDRIFFARYTRPPTKEDFETVLAQIATAHQRLRQPLIYIASIDAKTKVPNADERNNLNNLLTALRDYCEVVHLIIEGNDLQNSLQRVIISGMLIVTRTYDNYLSVHKNIESTASDLARRLNKDVSALIRMARDRGLVT